MGQSLSVVIVLVPAPVSVTVVVRERLPLLMSATNNTITIIPPTTHTHGIVYHSLCSVVVVFTVVLVLSCAQQSTSKKLNIKVAEKYFKKRGVEKIFIIIFLVKKSIVEMIYSTITPNENTM